MERDCLFSFFHFLVLSDAVGGVEGPGYVMPHAEKTAPGTVAVGMAAKWALASPTASPEFCMPTSMVMARTFCGVMPKRRAARWPKAMPPRLCKMTATRITRPWSKMVLPERETTQRTVTIMTKEENMGMKREKRDTVRGKK